MKKYYKALLSVDTDEIDMEMHCADPDEGPDEDEEHEAIAEAIADSVDGQFSGVELLDAVPCPAAEMREYTGNTQAFNPRCLVLSPELLKAVRFALNDIPNTKLGLDDYKDTYAIAAALTQAVKEQGVLT